MKRPPGFWILLSVGVLWVSLQDVDGIRATALIFGKSTTTTTTTTEGSAAESNETTTESSTEVSNVTKPTLTGIPQIDYIWDPNLPKELNGYNLSSYPFYERVPEDIDFKCDGLHDGFYASVPHKCQVYHHCLFGTRYDFLCANYTAFDQKTFICHFVSEVDCVNSKKYWHRNDALYKATTTTTVKPLVVYHHTPPPEAASSDTHPSPAGPNYRPGGGRRRPPARRRPQYDYYDYDSDYDYYEERPRYEGRRRRPRPRPRPLYDYEEEYEDDRYGRRGSGRRNENRKPYRGSDDRRLERRRNKDRRRYEDEDKYEDDEVYEEERKRPNERGHHKKRPVDEDPSEEDRRSRPKRPVEENRPKRPVEDDYEEEEKSAEPALPADKPIIKPTSGSSIYDRPRAAPKIKPPVPKSEASKYAYKPVAPKSPPAEEEEYYDDYEEEPPKKIHKPEETRRHSTRREETRDTRKQMRPRAPSSREDDEEIPRRPKPKYRERSRPANKKPPPIEDEYDEEYEELSKERSNAEPKTEKLKDTATTTTTTTSTTTTTTTTTPKPITTTEKEMPKPETIVRIVKRPFLPSRGGNPYAPRGLQPVGAKALDKKPDSKEEKSSESEEEAADVKALFKPSPAIIKMPSRQKYAPHQVGVGPRTTQKPKLPDSSPLDIDDDEYDVTLNDALNPTLPNLPVRGFPTGFSSANDYNYRPRYVLEGASSEYVYQQKPARQRFESVPYNSQEQFVNSQNFRPRVTQAYY